MTNEELLALAAKVKEGTATAAEQELFFREFQEKVADLEQYVATLPKITDEPESI
jgi:hypothetical protein